MFDTAPGSKHSSPLVNRQEYRPEETTKNYSYETAKVLKNKLWDFVRETPCFAAMMQSLEKAAK